MIWILILLGMLAAFAIGKCIGESDAARARNVEMQELRTRVFELGGTDLLEDVFGDTKVVPSRNPSRSRKWVLHERVWDAWRQEWDGGEGGP